MNTVLIVDDERILTDAYELSLTKAGFKVFIANVPEQGIEIAIKEKPDVIVLDMLMPQMNGIEFLKALKKKMHLGKTKVLAFSNIENESVVKAAKKLGVVDYLLKVNYTPHQLADLIEMELRK